MNRKRRLGTQQQRKTVSPEKNALYIRKLSDMVNCRTVYTVDGKYRAEFDRFYRVLEEHFPLLCAKAEKLTFGSGCFFYILRGRNAKRNILLMSHHDVVDGSDRWQTDPFHAEIRGEFLWGRGTIDTKTPLFAELQAAEELLEEGYDFPGINLYIGSSNNEETSGDGMVLAAEYFREQGIRFDIVLDEGGAILGGQVPGVTAKSAMVAVHEKSRHLYRCTTAADTSGHTGFGMAAASPVVRMSRFIAEVDGAKIYKARFYPETEATFSAHVPYMAFPMSLLFGHMRLFAPILKGVMAKIPPAAAMLKTGISFQSVQARKGSDPAARADHAESYMMLRCVREEDLYEGLERIRAIGKKHGVEIVEEQRDFCHPTDFTAAPFRRLEALLNENFPDVIVAPFLLTAGTDARRLTDVADNILRFAPIDLDSGQFASIHGEDERIRIENVGECVRFYKDYIKLEAEQ